MEPTSYLPLILISHDHYQLSNPHLIGQKEIRDSREILDKYESVSKPVDQSIPGQLKSPPNKTTTLGNLCMSYLR